MPTGQALAGFLAIVLVLGAVIRVVRGGRSPSAIAWASVVTPIPAAGLALYALQGGHVAQSYWLLGVVGVAIFGDLLISWRAATLKRSWLFKRGVTLDMFGTLNRYVLATYACTVVAIGAFVFFFESWFAIAYLVACGMWVAFWVPRRWRRTRYEVAASVGAPPSRVYAFVIEPSNWRSYQADLEEVAVRPEGVLRVGSEITVRRQYPVGFVGKGALPISVATTVVVTAMVPDLLYADRLVGGGDVGSIEVRPSGAGSMVTIRADGMVPRVEAILGLTFERAGQRAARRKVSLQNLARLDALLSAPGETQ